MELPVDLPAEKLEVLLERYAGTNEPIEFTTQTFSNDAEIYVEQVLSSFLKIINQEKMADFINYFVKELMVNAKKANTKRVYFDEKGLDINNVEDYQRGMENFKEDTISNINHYLELQEEKDLYIKLVLRKENDSIVINVKNNVKITEQEKKRIVHKLEMGSQYNALEDALSDVVDTMEGAGLGLIILMMMMRKLRIGGKIGIKNENGITSIGVTIPFKT